MWSLVKFVFFKVMLFSFDSPNTLIIEPLWRIFLARFIRRRNKKSHTKLNSIGNKSGKEVGS